MLSEVHSRLRRSFSRHMDTHSEVVAHGQVRTALGSEGGVAEGIATVQGHVQGVLMQEEAAAALSRGEGGHHVSHPVHA
jgi:hypothetical protein